MSEETKMVDIKQSTLSLEYEGYLFVYFYACKSKELSSTNVSSLNQDVLCHT